MHCESLLRLSIEEVNFTSVPKTNIALSVLKAKQLQWTTIVCKNCKNGETAHYDKTGGYGWPPAEWENISGEVGTVNWGSNPPTPHGTSHPGSSASRWLYSTSAQLSLWIHSVPLTKTRTSSHRWYLFLASSFFSTPGIYTTWGRQRGVSATWMDWLTDDCSGAVRGARVHRWSLGCRDWRQRLHHAVWNRRQLGTTAAHSVQQQDEIRTKSGNVVSVLWK